MTNTRPTQAIGLRPVTPADEPFLFEVYASSRAEELAPTGWSEAQQEFFLRSQFAARPHYYGTHLPQTANDIILFGAQPAGYWLVQRDEQEIRLIDFAVLPPFYNQGIELFLVEELLAEAAQTARPVRHYVGRFDPVRAFFEELGFKIIEDIESHLLLEFRPASSDGPAETAS